MLIVKQKNDKGTDRSPFPWNGWMFWVLKECKMDPKIMTGSMCLFKGTPFFCSNSTKTCLNVTRVQVCLEILGSEWSLHPYRSQIESIQSHTDVCHYESSWRIWALNFTLKKIYDQSILRAKICLFLPLSNFCRILILWHVPFSPTLWKRLCRQPMDLE